jgi:hypothetical protein
MRGGSGRGDSQLADRGAEGAEEASPVIKFSVVQSEQAPLDRLRANENDTGEAVAPQLIIVGDKTYRKRIVYTAMDVAGALLSSPMSPSDDLFLSHSPYNHHTIIIAWGSLRLR